MFKVTVTNKGVECIIREGFKYRKFRVKSNGDILWRCTSRNCSSSLVTNNSSSCIISLGQAHNHDVCSPRSLERHVIRNACKRKATEDLHERPAKLIRKELTVIENENLHSRDITSIRKAVYLQRRKLFPNNPRSLAEALTQANASEVVTSANERFIHVSFDDEIIILTTERNLTFMCHSEVLLADGTFYVSPQHFSQLYTIHTFRDNVYYQLIFCFLPRKTADCYTRLWAFIKRLCESFALNFTPTTVMLDFEKAAHLGLQAVFPEASIFGCNFHLGQSFFRKIQHLGLQQDYVNNTTSGQYLKQYFGLAYLPDYLVEEAFLDILMDVPADERVGKFIDYVLHTYIAPHSTFPSSVWAAPPTGSHPRTTNGPESYHRHLKDQFFSPHSSIHLVTDVLIKLQSETYIKMNHSSPRKKCKYQKCKETYIQTLWKKYELGELSLKDYVRQVGFRTQAVNLY